MKQRTTCSLFAIALTLLTPMTSSVVVADDPVKVFAPAEIQADFDELYQRLQESHFDLYARRSKADYDKLYQQMRTGFDRPLTSPEIQARFQPFVAFGKVAHARIDTLQSTFGVYRQKGGKALPLAIRVVDGVAYVADNNSGLSTLQRGDELLALNGKPMSALLTEIGRNVSADNDYMLHTLLELWFPAMVWQQFGSQDQFVVQLRRNGGKPFTVTVPARTRADAMAAAATQSPMLELDWDKREARVLENALGYLRPGPFYNNEPDASNVWDVTPFTHFIDDAFARFEAAGVKNLLIDLRDNPGGDNSFSDVMLGWIASKPFRFAADFQIRVSTATTESNRQRLVQSAGTGADASRDFDQLYRSHKNGEIVHYELPFAQPRSGKRFTGNVFLLINRRSYSNTVMVAAMVQDYGFGQILGEETSDLATTYGAMEQFTLSRTGIVVGYPKAHILRPNGSTQARGVIPDLPITTPILETPDDPVLQAAIRIAQRGATRN